MDLEVRREMALSRLKAIAGIGATDYMRSVGYSESDNAQAGSLARNEGELIEYMFNEGLIDAKIERDLIPAGQVRMTILDLKPKGIEILKEPLRVAKDLIKEMQGSELEAEVAKRPKNTLWNTLAREDMERRRKLAKSAAKRDRARQDDNEGKRHWQNLVVAWIFGLVTAALGIWNLYLSSQDQQLKIRVSQLSDRVQILEQRVFGGSELEVKNKPQPSPPPPISAKTSPDAEKTRVLCS